MGSPPAFGAKRARETQNDGQVIRLAIGAAAYAAIAAILLGSVGVEQQRAPNGDYFIWLDPAVVNRLAAMRGPGESCSDVILRLAKERL